MSENPRGAWPKELQDAYHAGQWNGAVGSILVSETPKLRVWHLQIPAGTWFGFHRHVLSHFWTALTDGRSRNWFEDGSTAERILYKGFTQHRELQAANTSCTRSTISATPIWPSRPSNSSMVRTRRCRFPIMSA
jgi:hypothetical protein